MSANNTVTMLNFRVGAFSVNKTSLTSEYSVYARALGKPGGHADMTTGAYQWIDLNLNGVVDPGELFLKMSVISLPLDRTNGKQVRVIHARPFQPEERFFYQRKLDQTLAK